MYPIGCTIAPRLLSACSAIVLCAGAGVLVPGSATFAQTSVAMQEQTTRPVVKSQLSSKGTNGNGKITLIVRDSPVVAVVRTLGSLSGRQVIYNDKSREFAKRISVAIRNVSVMEAFQIALKGTGLIAILAQDGETIIVRPATGSTDSATTAVGQMLGRVLDSATKQGIANVTISMQGTRLTTTTTERGEFSFPKVPAGEYTLVARSFGYIVSTRRVTITDNARTSVTIILVPTPTSLSEVVTTATGQQKRYEIGNSVTSINVDSLLRVVPARTVTDVLDAGRVPGLIVSRGSGAPGAPARIRMRGVGSINASNDPIIIVDGVRVYSDQTTNTDNANYSVLDRIDVNLIERIEVLKGASASAQYGSDAANGVIIIQTKRGSSGPTRWTFKASQEVAEQPWSLPDSYVRFGISPLGGRPQAARLGSEGNDFFELQVFNLFADDRTSVLGQGRNGAYSGSVSGGSPTLQFTMGGSYNHDIGQLKMSDADRALVTRQTGIDVPNWMKRPEQFSRTSGMASMIFYPSRELTFTLSNTLSRSLRSETPYKNAFGLLQTGEKSDSTLTAGQILDFRRRMTYNDWSTLNTLSSTWTPQGIVTVAGTLGYQVIDSRSRSILRRGECTNLLIPTSSCAENSGVLDLKRLGRNVTTANMRVSTRIPQRWGIRLTPLLGVDYNAEAVTNQSTVARDLMVGSSSVNGAGTISTTESTPVKRSFGMIGNLGISLFDQRIFTQIGTRIDASSALGWEVRPVYPKLDLSYLMSDEPWLPRSFSTLRLRMAYGHSARQPGIGATARTYIGRDGVENGVVIPTLLMSGVGNPVLRPERSQERELGFDVGFLRDRLTLGLTHYSTRTRDMLVSRNLPPSLGGWGWTSNLGTVTNTGLEAELGVRVFDSDWLGWSIQTNVSTYTNRLRSVASDFDLSFRRQSASPSETWWGQRYAIGYPIDGWWMYPVVTYDDVNGDGALSSSEILRSDSSIFVGSPTPKYNASVSSTLSLWSGRVQLNGNAHYINRMIQANRLQISTIPFVVNTLRPFNDPSTPLETQALAQSGYMFLHPISTFRVTSMSILMNVSPDMARIFRARAMSVSLTGNNLGLWSNYSGADPDVNESIVGSQRSDSGQLPMPRRWGLNVSLSY